MPLGFPVSPTYGFVMVLFRPVVKWWGRMEVEGLDVLPESGPLLIAGNHDSYWDPIAIGMAAVRRRQICALAKAQLWDIKGLGPILDGMGQIPILRGQSDSAALARAIEELRAGRCIGVFPEGTRSRGRELRPRSGFGRLAEAVPGADVVCVAVEDTVKVGRFPTRPRIRVRFFRPAGGGLQPGEAPADFSARLLREIRALAPVPPQRGAKPGGVAA